MQPLCHIHDRRKTFSGRSGSLPTTGRRSASASASARRARPGWDSLERREMLSLAAVAAPADVSALYNGNQTAGYNQCVAQAADGHYVAVWNENIGGIKARLFNADGSSRSGEIVISSFRQDTWPVVAMNASGTFTVAWNHSTSSGNRDIYYQVFKPDGSPKIRVTAVATSTLDEYSPSVGIDAAGNSAIAYVQRNAAGNSDVKLAWLEQENGGWGWGGDQFYHDVATTSKNEYHPSLAMNAAGDVVVAYALDYSTSDQDVLARYFNAAALQYKPGAISFLRSIAVSGRKELDSVAAINANGDFAVGYTDVRSETTVPGGGFFGPTIYFTTDVRVAVYNKAGTWLRTVDAATDPNTNEYSPAIALKADDGLQVAYTAGGQYHSVSINPLIVIGDPGLVHLRDFGASGSFINETTVGMAWQDNTKAAFKPSLAMGSDTNGVLLWESPLAKPFQDVVGSGVFAQPFRELPFQIVVHLPNNASALPLTNGMGTSFTVEVKRDPGFAGTVNVSVAGLPAGFTGTVRAAAQMVPGSGVSDQRTITITAPVNSPSSSWFTFRVQAGLANTTPMSVPVPALFSALAAWGVSPSNAVTPQPGLPGTTVRITGRGFSPGMKAQFPSRSASPLIASALRVGTDSSGYAYVDVKVPTGAISGPLTVINPAGARATTSNSLTIGPQVFSVSTMSGDAPQEARPGTVVTIRGLGFAPGTTVTFAGVAADPGTLALSSDGTTITVNVPRLAVDGDLVVRIADGTVINRGKFTVNSFRERNALAFGNFNFNIATGLVMDAWGDQAVSFSIPISGNRVPSPGTLAFTAFAAATLNNSGACFGMVLTAERLIQHPEWIGNGQFPLANPSGPRTVNNVRGTGESIKYIEMQHLYQYSQEVINYYFNWQKASHTSAGVYNAIRSELLAGRHPIISMQEGLGKGHAVLAYDLEGTPSHFWIDVYDSNRPYTSAENTALTHGLVEKFSRVEILPDNRWKFDMAGSELPYVSNDWWEGGFGTLMVLPTRIIPEQPTMPSVLDTIRGIVFGATGSPARDTSSTADSVRIAPVMAPPQATATPASRRSVPATVPVPAGPRAIGFPLRASRIARPTGMPDDPARSGLSLF